MENENINQTPETNAPDIQSDTQPEALSENQTETTVSEQSNILPETKATSHATRSKPVYKAAWFWVLMALATVIIVLGIVSTSIFVMSPTGSYSRRYAANNISAPTLPTAKPTEAPTAKSEEDENLVVYDEKGLKVIYTGCDKGTLSTKFNFLLLNSSNSSYAVMSKDESINDSMVSIFFYEKIAPGKKSVASMTVYGSDLKENNIDDIEKLEFKIHCYDSDDFMESFDSGVITINNP